MRPTTSFTMATLSDGSKITSTEITNLKSADFTKC